MHGNQDTWGVRCGTPCDRFMAVRVRDEYLFFIWKGRVTNTRGALYGPYLLRCKILGRSQEYGPVVSTANPGRIAWAVEQWDWAVRYLMWVGPWWRLAELLVLFQIVGRLIFSTINLTTRLIQKFVQNITSFVVGCFINTKFLRMT